MVFVVSWPVARTAAVGSRNSDKMFDVVEKTITTMSPAKVNYAGTLHLICYAIESM